MSRDLDRTILHASWLAIGLGLLIEAMQLAFASGLGAPSPAVAAVLAETVQKISWSYVVCVALACGMATSAASPTLVGLVGLFAAPVAFATARAIHKSISQTLSLPAVAAGVGPTPATLAVIKGLEYLVLGLLAARVLSSSRAGFGSMLAAGVTVGVVFGGFVVWLHTSMAPAPLPTPALAGRIINEILFPIGCACVLWVTRTLTRR